MGWTTITDGMDLQAASFLAEYVDAVNERAAIVQPIYIHPEPDEGQNLQEGPTTDCSWSHLQQTVENLAPYFLNSHDYPTGFDGLADCVAYTLSTWKAAAGLPNGWRRATTWPTDWTDYDDPAFSYGRAQYGDILGPWLFADLQAGINQLVWMKGIYAGWSRQGETNGGVVLSSAWPTVAEAKADAEAQWPWLYTKDGGPNCMAYVQKSFNPTRYNAYAERAYSYGTWSSAPAVTKDIDFYAKVDLNLSNEEYDGNGDFTVPVGTVQKWHTEAGTPAASGVTSAPFGGLGIPAWPVGSPDDDPYFFSRGYVASYPFLVFRFDIEGGFEYR